MRASQGVALIVSQGVALRVSQDVVFDSHVESELHLLCIQRNPRVGADQTGEVSLGGDADKLHTRHGLTHNAGVGNDQTKVEVGDGEADGVRVGRFVAQLVVTVGVGEVRAVDARKRRNIAPTDDQCVDADSWHAHAGHIHVDLFNHAFLERDTAFEGEHIHDIQACVTDRGRQHAFVHVEQNRLAVVAGGDGHSLAVAALGEVDHQAVAAALVDA